MDTEFLWEDLRENLQGWRVRICEDNIKMDLEEVGCDARNWIGLVQDVDQLRALVRVAMNFRVP